MSSAPTHLLRWINHISPARPLLLSITRLIQIMPNAKSQIYVTLDRQGNTCSPQTRSSRKGKPAQNEPAFSLPLLSHFPLQVRKKCLRTSSGWIFQTKTPALRVLRDIGDVEIYIDRIRCQEIWMATSTCLLLDPWLHTVQKVSLYHYPLTRWMWVCLFFHPVFHTHVLTLLWSQKTRSENSMQPSHLFPPSVPLSAAMSLCLEDPSNPADSAPPQGIEARHQFEEYGRGVLPPAVPMRVIPERAHTFRPSVAAVAPPMQKPLYACPHCPRDFQLPNGLALHLKWHERVRRLETNLTSHMNHRPQDRVQPKPKNPRTELGPLGPRDMGHAQLPTQRNTMGVATSYTAPQRAGPAQVEYVSRSLGCMFVVSLRLTRYSR